MRNRAAVECFHCYLLIAEVRTKGARCRDLTVDGESSAASSWIVIEGLTVQRGREFVDSERQETESGNRPVKKCSTGETSGDGEFCRRCDGCFTSPIGL